MKPLGKVKRGPKLHPADSCDICSENKKFSRTKAKRLAKNQLRKDYADENSNR